MDAVTEYIYDKTGNEREILSYLHDSIRSLPGIEVKIRFQIPFYYRKSWICYLNVLKKGGVELAFIRANELISVHHLLDFNNRKQVAGITFHKSKDIDMELVNLILLEAIDLDESKRYASKKTKKPGR